MENKPTSKVPILKITGATQKKSLDNITTEGPLEISISLPKVQPKIYNKSISITMRTPGKDLELAIGFLYSEGILAHPSEILDALQQENKIHLILDHNSDKQIKNLDRHFYTSSSCGVCGKSSIEAIKPIVKSTPSTEVKIEVGILKTLPDILKSAQQIFKDTGGIHAAALFSTDGQLQLLCEDVGRHNALDKLIGSTFLKDQDLSQSVLLLSGRISFELVHKAAVAHLPIIAAIGAPSSLAIETAEAFDITLIGFLNKEGFNCYNGEQRLVL